MDITYAEWCELAELASTYSEAHKELEHKLLMTALKYPDGSEERAIMLDQVDRLENGCLLSMSPQSEWTGGDSSDPKNFKMREPHAAGGLSSKRYFSEEEIAEWENRTKTVGQIPGTIKRLHVDMPAIRRNMKLPEGEPWEPVITIQNRGKSTKAYRVEFKSGTLEQATKPLGCGARVWIETTDTVIADGKEIL